jgi:hypothetical protein
MHLSYQIKELKAVQSKYSKGCYCCVASMKPSNSEGEPLVALAREVECCMCGVSKVSAPFTLTYSIHFEVLLNDNLWLMNCNVFPS